ncbi:MAG: L-threonylcarbamoyladenylate synthase [Myxococcales bacterium]
MDERDLELFVPLLRAGGVVACPTDTLQGLLADAWSEAAVQAVVTLKRRGPDPIALILPSLEALSQITDVCPEPARELARRHWPGPLTLLVKARPGLPAALIRDGKVGVRVPGPSPALELVRRFGGALTATSANLSGQPAARTANEVKAYFPEGLAGQVWGDAPGGLPSTVVDVGEGVLRVIRVGAIALP